MKEYSKGIYVKFKPEEVEILHDRMKEAGVQNMSAYIRKMALNGYVIIPEWPDLNRVISLHARISNNLNQYARKANETGKLYEEDIAEIKKMNNEQTELLKKHLKQLFIYMRTIQRRESELIKSVSVALRFIRSSRDWGRKTSGGRLFCADRSGTETFPNKQICAGYIPGHCLPMSKKERISIMLKNKVVIKERDTWSDLANFIGEMVAKYADTMGLDQLPDPDNYLRMKRMKQLYMELYKTENIEKFRSIIIPIERNAAA